MGQDRDRLAPWSGAVFVVLVIAGGVMAGNTPGAKATGAKVLSFYLSHHAKSQAAAVLLTLAFVALVLFAAALRTYFRRAGADGLAAALLAGAAILATGQTINVSFTWALAKNAKTLSPTAAQVLNVAQNDVVLASAAGWFIFSSVAWLTIMRTRALPIWVGWVSLVIAVVVLTPLELIGFLLFVIWVAVATVLTARRWPPPVSTGRS
ncbi:MAG: hypothetical protein JO079_05710 [Frankiaceae bacterium]|nr:hypothetical protein [Frankiaceae bacterium]MBV9368566.1 hypothetical protein [Frankiales bacterium]